MTDYLLRRKLQSLRSGTSDEKERLLGVLDAYRTLGLISSANSDDGEVIKQARHVADSIGKELEKRSDTSED